MKDSCKFECSSAIHSCTVSLFFLQGLKRKLEHDHNLVTKKKRLVHLPAQPNIVSVQFFM